MGLQIRKDIEDYLNDNDNGKVSLLILCDACKAVLRGKKIAYSSNLKNKIK